MPKQLIIKRVVLTLLYAVFFVVLPSIIIAQHYDIFGSTEKNSSVKITAGLVIVCLLIFFFLRNVINKFLQELAPGNFKKALKTVYKSIPWVAIDLVVWVTRENVNNLLSCLIYLSVSFTISNFISAYLDDVIQVCAEIKLMKRQDKYRKDYSL